MPYIKQEQRDRLDPSIYLLIRSLQEDPENLDGNFNYAVTRLLKKLYPPKYKNFNSAIGVLNCIQLEFYRKVVAPYENLKEVKMEKFQNKSLEWLLLEIRRELAYAQNKFLPYNSSHEGYAVIAEELDELWDEVKAKPYVGKNERMTREAIQIATTAIRFVLDVSLPASQKGEENVT